MVMFVFVRPVSMVTGHPLGVSIQIALVFPDRHTVLNFVDDITTSPKSSIAMWSGNADPYCDIANVQAPGAMHGNGMADVISRHGFIKDALAFFCGQSIIGFIIKTIDRAPFVGIAYPPSKEQKPPA